MKSTDYIESIGKWIVNSINDVSTVPGRPDMVCYGTGYDTWGVQTQQKAFAAYATYALLAEPGRKTAGMTNDQIMGLALKMLRFNLESHIAGSFACLDGKKWGHTWLTGLGTERMMSTIDAICDRIPAQDKALLRKVLVSEADWLLNEYPVEACPDNTGPNKPESNLWNGALLHRTAMMYPDTPNAEKYREKAYRFLINSISVPSDKDMNAIVDGRKVSDFHVAGNFQESYALIHHGYMNVGYMVICLSNIAMLHFSYKERGIAAPEALYHHAHDLWKLVKQLTAPDGRLLRIGGDTRVRYFYCQDYALPAWLFIADKYGDAEALEFEKSWIETVCEEQDYNKNGSYSGKRLAGLKEASPLYYTRLESDRAVTFALAALWRNRFNLETGKKEAAGSVEWHDEFHGSTFVRNEKSLRSWTWRAARTPFGLCHPLDDSSLAEWDFSMSGELKGTGARYGYNLLSHKESCFKNGFTTMGKIQIHSLMQTGEGQQDDKSLEEQIAFAALPDGATVICMQYAKSLCRIYLREVKGLMLPVPNDIFNDFRRSFRIQKKSIELKGLEAPYGIISLDSKIVNIEGKVNVELLYGADSLVINRGAARQISIKHNPPENWGSLYAEELCSKCILGTKKYEACELILDECFAVQAGAAYHSPRFVNIDTKDIPAECRVAAYRGADDKTYVLAANFGNDNASINLGKDSFRLEAGECRLMIQ